MLLFVAWLTFLKLINNNLFIKRKQRKSLPWRRLGNRILISIKFCKLLLWISPRIMNGLRSHIKNSKECFIRYPNTSNSVKKTRLRLIFSSLDILMKHSFSCLIYYFLPLFYGLTFEVWMCSYSEGRSWKYNQVQSWTAHAIWCQLGGELYFKQ